MKSRFLDALRERLLLGDGAMGTELLARGAGADRNLSLTHLENPDLVLQIHREYADAGAELLRTNTFTANRFRMDAGRVREANIEGARIARAAAGPDRFVAGSIGPLGDLDLAPDEARRAFAEQAQALVDGGCDALILETFSAIGDLLSGLKACANLGVPIIAQTFRVAIAISAESLGRAGAHVVGTNCASLKESLEILIQMKGQDSSLPRSAFPNSGAPGRYAGPEAFVGGALALIEMGTRLIGGCCGTTPDHIRALARRLGR